MNPPSHCSLSSCKTAFRNAKTEQRQRLDSKTRTQSSNPELLVSDSGRNRRGPVAANGEPLTAENRPSAGSYQRAAISGPAS